MHAEDLFFKAVECRDCNAMPDITVSYAKHSFTAEVSCPSCETNVRKCGAELFDTFGRVLNTWNDMNTDY